MHTIDPKTGKLVPEKCSAYPFCDTCAPPKPSAMRDPHPLFSGEKFDPRSDEFAEEIKE